MTNDTSIQAIDIDVEVVDAPIELALVVKNEGVAGGSATEILSAFSPHYLLASDLVKKAEALIESAGDVPDGTNAKMARLLRLELRTARGLAGKKLKSLKTDALRFSRAVDGVNNLFLLMVKPVEERLAEIENAREVAAEKAKVELRLQRDALVAPYDVNTRFIVLEEMTAEVFQEYLDGLEAHKVAKIAAVKKFQDDLTAASKKAEDDRFAAEKKAKEDEAARVAKDAAEKAERDAENERLRKEKAAAESEAVRVAKEAKEEADRLAAKQAEKDAAAKKEQDRKDAAAKAEQDRKDAEAKAEQEKRDAAAKVERDRIEKEKAEALAAAEVERKKREELEAKAKADKDAVDAEAARVAKEKADKDAAVAAAAHAAAMAPDKKKLEAYADALRLVPIPELKDSAAIEVRDSSVRRLQLLILRILSSASEL